MPANRKACGVRYRHLKGRGPCCDKYNAYKKRDAVLFRIGYASYRDYINSKLWKAIRSAKLSCDPQCELCGHRAQHVHHQSYSFSTLTGRNPKGLVSICASCHQEIEFRQDGTKRNFEAVMKRTRHLLARRRKEATAQAVSPTD